jgi:hypothetical protein
MGELEVRRPTNQEMKQARKRWGWARADQATEELFKAAVKEFRLRHLDHMHDLLTQLHVKRGERIARELEATDNPLTKEMLLRQAADWVRQSADVLER